MAGTSVLDDSKLTLHWSDKQRMFLDKASLATERVLLVQIASTSGHEMYRASSGEKVAYH